MVDTIVEIPHCLLTTAIGMSQYNRLGLTAENQPIMETAWLIYDPADDIEKRRAVKTMVLPASNDDVG